MSTPISMTSATGHPHVRCAPRRTRWLQRGLAVVAVVALGGWEPFRAPDPDVEAGNLAYGEGRYDDALAAYDRARRRGAVDDAGLAFDRGTALLKKADAAKQPDEKRRLTERALEDLARAARSQDPHVRGAAGYNRGNALMAQDKLDEAIEAYKQALRDDAGLDDARLNLELALRRRQSQQKRQQQGQGGRGQGQQGQGQQGQGQQGQGQQGQGQQGQGQQGQGQQGQGSQGQGGSNQNDQNGQNGQGSNQDPDAGGQGSAQQNGQNGSGSQGANPQSGQGSSAQGSNQSGSNAQDGSPGRNPQPKGRPRDRTSRPPKTPAETRLDDLDEYSRRLQKNKARRSATGRASDPQHDW